MKTQRMVRKAKRLINPAAIALAIGAAFGSPIGMVQATEGVDPEADRILKIMSTYLAGLPALSVEADVDNEIIDLAGQKLQLSSGIEMSMQRPDKFHVTRQGPFAESQMFFDGQTVTLSVEDASLYSQIQAPGQIDDAIATIRSTTGLDAPAGDLFYADPYSGLLTDVISGTYNGTAFVQGVECHHLAFRATKVDWQIWVEVGDAPLPRKYVITSKWITGAPQFSIRFRRWNTNPEVDAKRFVFVPGEGATSIERFTVNAMGEMMPKEDQR